LTFPEGSRPSSELSGFRLIAGWVDDQIESKARVTENMKRCPQCNRFESDNSLAFCRVDVWPNILFQPMIALLFSRTPPRIILSSVTSSILKYFIHPSVNLTQEEIEECSS
jgi:hypothetical protein